jgi:histidinol-phosphate aminotransferase
MLSSEKIVQMWINTTILKNSREYLKLTLNKLGLFEKILTSDGNFLFAKTNYATELQQYLKEGGILLRKFNTLNNYLRVSVGSNEENQKLIDLLKKWEPYREK